jgi:F420-non-reducing hydrogenase iron-sulfur subunit
MNDHARDHHDHPFEPKIVGFLCNWCSYRAADLAGTARIKYRPNVRVIRLMCSGRVDPAFVLKALAAGADGVMVAGCHPGECHYLVQNYKTIRRVHMLRHTLRAMGIDDARVRLQWASAAEGQRLADAINEMVEQVRALGPLEWPHKWREGDGLERLEADVTAADQCLGRPHAERTDTEGVRA